MTSPKSLGRWFCTSVSGRYPLETLLPSLCSSLEESGRMKRPDRARVSSVSWFLTRDSTAAFQEEKAGSGPRGVHGGHRLPHLRDGSCAKSNEDKSLF